MLKKIIKTHTARLDFVDIIKPRNAVATNRQRRVIASSQKMCYYDASQLKKYTCWSSQIAHK